MQKKGILIIIFERTGRQETSRRPPEIKLITIKAEHQENMAGPNRRRDIELKVLSIEMDLAKCGGVF